MKIVSWNCNLNFAKKYQHIENHDADVIIIQECENLKEDYFPDRKFFWTGRIENKGLGIMIKDSSARLSLRFNKNLINFLPIETNSLKILGAWAYNHRAAKFGNNVSGNTIDAISYYEEWIAMDSYPSIFAGDLNNSIIWDKENNANNFENINSALEKVNFSSAYHSFTNEKFGSEINPTFFHTKNETKKYHIDYVFSKSLDVDSVEVGKYADWIKLSDHCPIIIKFKTI